MKPQITAQAESILGLYHPVLDHGFVSLVDVMGGDEAIEQAARVSYGGGTRNVSDTRHLIRYLMRHQHLSPCEMVELKFHCSMPIFVARQWIRHRTANVNELSGRYSIVPTVFYSPEPEQYKAQSKDNKQGRGDRTDNSTYAITALARSEAHKDLTDLYEWQLGEGVARELARIDLPLSTYTQWYWKIDLRNLFHFLTLRCDSHAQWEIREYAKVMAGMVKLVAPFAFEAWYDYEYAGVKMSRHEMECLRYLLQPDHDLILHSDHTDGLYLGADTYPVNGMSKREVDEFLSKLHEPQYDSFDLDLSRMKPASFFDPQGGK
jgi:thymidylate synthase (FAD)